jgi:hypothetical protein
MPDRVFGRTAGRVLGKQADPPGLSRPSQSSPMRSPPITAGPRAQTPLAIPTQERPLWSSVRRLSLAAGRVSVRSVRSAQERKLSQRCVLPAQRPFSYRRGPRLGFRHSVFRAVTSVTDEFASLRAEYLWSCVLQGDRWAAGAVRSSRGFPFPMRSSSRFRTPAPATRMPPPLVPRKQSVDRRIPPCSSNKRDPPCASTSCCAIGSQGARGSSGTSLASCWCIVSPNRLRGAPFPTPPCFTRSCLCAAVPEVTDARRFFGHHVLGLGANPRGPPAL